MKITDHPFRNDDAEYARIKDLLLGIESRLDEVDNNWDPGRMDWWRYNSHSGKGREFFERNAHFWQTTGGQVVGLFVSERGKNDFFAVIHPDHWDFLPTVLSWVRDVWGDGKPSIHTDVYSYGERKVAALEADGFCKTGHVENVRIYPLSNYDFSYELKPGYQLMSFVEYGNYESRVDLVRNAFENSGYTEARLRSTQSTPGYRPELDLVVVNDERKAVAYCMGWLEEANPKSGYIEPMGVHSDYRKLGFGKAIAKECFRRLAEAGAERAWIASEAEPNVSNFLYESLGPMQTKRSYRYTLNLG